MGVQRARAQPMNVITPVKRWWGAWLRFSWPGAEHVWPINAITKAPLKNLRFIHFAHWGLLTRMPAKGGKRLPFSYIVFHTNYNGDAHAYVDAFAVRIPGRMQLLWHGAIGFPGTEPMGPLRRYVQDRMVPTLHYYCAYPEASFKMIDAGLALREHRAALLAAARSDSDEQFAKRYAHFIAEHGDLL